MRYINNGNKHMFIDGAVTPEILQHLKNKLYNLKTSETTMCFARVYGLKDNEVIGRYAFIKFPENDIRVVPTKMFGPTLTIVKESDLDKIKALDKSESDEYNAMYNMISHKMARYACQFYYDLTGNWME